MSDETNPYAAPSDDPGTHRRRDYTARRIGLSLLVQKDAHLPDVCMKCGSHDVTERRKQTFAFTPQWAFMLFFLAGPLIAGLVMFFLQKRGTLLVPLCGDCAFRWKRARMRLGLAIAWLIGGMLLGFVSLANDAHALGLVLFASAILAVVVVAVVNRDAMLRALRVDKTTITLDKVHPDAIDAILAASEQLG